MGWVKFEDAGLTNGGWNLALRSKHLLQATFLGIATDLRNGLTDQQNVADVPDERAMELKGCEDIRKRVSAPWFQTEIGLFRNLQH